MTKGALRILVVDDDAVTRFLMTEFLETLGHRPTTVSSGPACMELVYDPRYSFDLILMDLNMPGQDGLATAAAIRAIDKPCAQALPILALTADTEFTLPAANAPMNGVLRKPMDLRSLERVLAPHVTRRYAKV